MLGFLVHHYHLRREVRKRLFINFKTEVMMKAKKSLGVIIVVMVLAIFLIMPNQVLASPLFSLDTFDDWNQAPISPVLGDYDAANEVYRNMYGVDYEFSPPELYVYEGDTITNPPLEDAGLVMVWGDISSELPQLASWEYVYPEDPDLIGTTLSITVTPPMGIWAVSLTLNDAALGWNTWAWYVATPGNPLPLLNPGAIPISPNVATTITLDPTLAANQSGSNVFAPGGFNPAIAVSIQADELSAGGFLPFPPNPITFTPQAWNYWSNLSVTIVCTTDADCDNGQFCDGVETCNAGVCVPGIQEPDGTQCTDTPDIPGDCRIPGCYTGVCVPGQIPETPGTACGDPSDTACDNPDSCDGAGDCQSNYEPAGFDCGDGQFCNSAETCSGVGSCIAGSDPCLVEETCDENFDICISSCEFDPRTQGYWHRQCLGLSASEGGLDPGRNGRGPKKSTETDFDNELMTCTDLLLEDLGFFGERTCLAMDADPPSDPCERALKQLTALILNVCSGRLANTCELDLSNISCSATSVEGLLQEASQLIQSGECELAADCASLVNEGEGLVFD
jgi:hypothetical protein